MTPQQDIEQRLLSLDSSYRNFILSDYFKEICDVFTETNNLSEAESIRLENGFVLLMTFIIDRPEFVVFVEQECGIAAGQGELLHNAFLQSLPIPILTAYEEIYREIYSQSSGNLLESEILEAEALLNNIPKPALAAEERVYTSTQSAILSEANTSAHNSPTSAPASNSRWDTDQ